MKKLSTKREGFTLIELLIVVAIIGIIAGIAIPNFLGARTKARVTRAFADMRALADALESYYVDETTYPDEPDEGDPIDGLSPYITSQPNDVFGTDEVPGYRYYNNSETAPTAWLVVSNGPDGDADVAKDDIDWDDDADPPRIAGEVGGPNGAEGGYGLTDEWSDGTPGSDGDLGRGGP